MFYRKLHCYYYKYTPNVPLQMSTTPKCASLDVQMSTTPKVPLQICLDVYYPQIYLFRYVQMSTTPKCTSLDMSRYLLPPHVPLQICLDVYCSPNVPLQIYLDVYYPQMYLFRYIQMSTTPKRTSLDMSRCLMAKCKAFSWFPRAVWAFPKLQHARPSPTRSFSSCAICRWRTWYSMARS